MKLLLEEKLSDSSFSRLYSLFSFDLFSILPPQSQIHARAANSTENDSYHILLGYGGVCSISVCLSSISSMQPSEAV